MKRREEPPTEVKKVPYRIEQQEDGDMFDEFSYSVEQESDNDVATQAVKMMPLNGGSESYRAPTQFVLPETSGRGDYKTNRFSVISDVVPANNAPEPALKPTLSRG